MNNNPEKMDFLQSLDSFPRKKTRSVNVKWGDKIITLGGGNPIVLQSMTSTSTINVIETAIQIKELTSAGSELVRITVDTPDAAREVPYIRDQLDKINCFVPLVGDFHFNGHKLLNNFPECAKALSKYRINPGNLGGKKYHDANFAKIIEIACRNNKPIRIGANWGSIDNKLLAKKIEENNRRHFPWKMRAVMIDTLITSVIDSAKRAEELGLSENSIVLSCKVSQVQDLIKTYEKLSNLCDYPLHLGLTEAGMGDKGIIASTAALAVLIQQGIGDTIRISLTPKPNDDRRREVTVAREILQTMGLRYFMPTLTACPGCGRTNSTFFRKLASETYAYIEKKMPLWQALYPGVENMNVAVMGCVVNGPGESSYADIGISLPGMNENQVAPVFIDGQHALTLKGNRITQEFQKIIENYVSRRYGSKTPLIS